MRYIPFLLLLSFLLSTPTLSQTIIPGGYVSGTWTQAGSPYLVEGDITIGNWGLLTIEPGVDVIFQGHYEFGVEGRIEANGTQTDSILFTAADTTEGWKGIRFYDSPSVSKFHYCILEYGNATGGWVSGYGGALYSMITDLELYNCTLRHNRAEQGGALFCADGEYLLDQCLVTQNYAPEGGAIYVGDLFGMGAQKFRVYDCTICENSADQQGSVIYCMTIWEVDFRNSIVANNHGVGAIWVQYMFGVFFNSIVNYNCFWGNEGGDIINGGPYGFGAIDTVNANGDSCDVLFNIFTDPLFVDPTQGDYHLQENSPCIDGGDPTLPRDPDGTIADIGLLYYEQILPVIDLSTDLLAFGPVQLGSQEQLPLVIFNIGLDDLIIDDIACSDPSFTTDFSSSPCMIPSHDSLTVTVTFSPLDSVNYDEVMVIYSNDEDITVSLDGVGLGLGMYISGPISGVLEATDYIVTGDLIVEDGDSLIIEPGANLFFTDEPGLHYSLIVNGCLIAIGTEEDSINFLPYEGVDNWGGIDLVDNPYSLSQVQYCNLEYSSSSGIYCYNTNPFISNCKINNCWGCGLYIDEWSNATVRYCLITENSWSGAGGIHITEDASAVIDYCIITDNSAPINHGGGINVHTYGSMELRNSVIKHNSCYGCGGGIIPSKYTTIERCVIDSNYAGQWGGGIYNAYDVPIQYCTFIGNGAGAEGGAIYCYNGKPEIRNCTFYGNTAANGGLISLNPWAGFSPYPHFVDCIFWNNTNHPFNLNNYDVNITFSDVQGGWEGQGNIDSDPLFYATSGDSAFYLTASSPCIDAGDPRSPRDLDRTRADMGAFYFPQGPQVPLPDMVLSNNFLGFGYVLTGTELQLPLKIYNAGDADLIISRVLTTGSAFQADFDPADSLIVPLDSLQLLIRFAPEDLGERLDSLWIKSNDELALVNLSGLGVNSIVSTSDDSLDFGWIYIGTQSQRSLKVYNNGNIDLLIHDISVDDTCFYTNWDPADSIIVPGDSLELSIFFAPADTVDYSELLFIDNSDSLLTVSLKGRGRLWVGVNDPAAKLIPSDFCLLPAYPNPFNPQTTIRFGLPATAQVKIAVYDIRGRRVATLTDGWRQAGYHDVTFDAENLASGVYFYRINAADFSATGKLLLLK